MPTEPSGPEGGMTVTTTTMINTNKVDHPRVVDDVGLDEEDGRVVVSSSSLLGRSSKKIDAANDDEDPPPRDDGDHGGGDGTASTRHRLAPTIDWKENMGAEERRAWTLSSERGDDAIFRAAVSAAVATEDGAILDSNDLDHDEQGFEDFKKDLPSLVGALKLFSNNSNRKNKPQRPRRSLASSSAAVLSPRRPNVLDRRPRRHLTTTTTPSVSAVDTPPRRRSPLPRCAGPCCDDGMTIGDGGWGGGGALAATATDPPASGDAGRLPPPQLLRCYEVGDLTFDPSCLRPVFVPLGHRRRHGGRRLGKMSGISEPLHGTSYKWGNWESVTGGSVCS